MQTTSLVPLPRTMIFRVHGPDASRYLHGRLTQDIKTLATGSGKRSLILSPNGKIQSHLLVLRLADSFFLLADPLTRENSVADFLQVLFQFKVADQVELENLTDSFVGYSLLGVNAKQMLERITASTIPDLPFAHAELSLGNIPMRIVHFPRGACDCFDLLISRNDEVGFVQFFRNVAESSQLQLGDENVLEQIRLLATIPRFELDLADSVMASDIDLQNLVSFQKGCYTGQEVVEMATARGRPNRKLRLLHSSTACDVTAKSEIRIRQDNQEISIGFTTNSCFHDSQGATLVLGFLKYQVDEKQTFFILSAPFTVIAPVGADTAVVTNE